MKDEEFLKNIFNTLDNEIDWSSNFFLISDINKFKYILEKRKINKNNLFVKSYPVFRRNPVTYEQKNNEIDVYIKNLILNETKKNNIQSHLIQNLDLKKQYQTDMKFKNQFDIFYKDLVDIFFVATYEDNDVIANEKYNYINTDLHKPHNLINHKLKNNNKLLDILDKSIKESKGYLIELSDDVLDDFFTGDDISKKGIEYLDVKSKSKTYNIIKNRNLIVLYDDNLNSKNLTYDYIRTIKPLGYFEKKLLNKIKEKISDKLNNENYKK